jgi:DNA ligase 4
VPNSLAQFSLALVKVFDILMINGKSLLEKSTTSRKKNLQNTVRSVPGRLEIVTGWMGSTEKDVRKHMEDVMNNRSSKIILSDIILLNICI